VDKTLANLNGLKPQPAGEERCATSPEPTQAVAAGVVMAPDEVMGINAQSRSAKAVLRDRVVFPMRSHAQFNGFQWLAVIHHFLSTLCRKKTDSCYS